MIREQLMEIADDEELLFADGFDDAIGVGNRCGQLPVIVYDRDKCIEILVNARGMDLDQAEEYFAFNVAGAWIGERTPMFVTRPKET
jgi:hypothetical protein